MLLLECGDERFGVEASDLGCSIGALTIRIGFWGP